MEANCMIMTQWDQLRMFVSEFGTEAAAELAKQLSPANAQALRHAIYLTEEGPKPWAFKAAQNVRLSPGEFRAMVEAMGRALKIIPAENKAAAAGGGATVPAALGLMTLLKAPVGTAFSVAPLASAGLIAGAGLAGYGLGTLADHATGWVRDDGRTISDLISGANAGVPIADPTGHGGTGWRLVEDKK